MNTLHHPDDATLASYAACALEANFAAVVRLHLEQCGHCKARVGEAERIAGALFDQLPPEPLDGSLKEQLFAHLDEPPLLTSDDALSTGPQLPDFLSHWQQTDFDALPWKRLAPGIRQIRIAIGEGKLNLLRIAPGTCLPAHGHNGNELTLVLSGSYSDEIGRFTPGSLADLDDSIDHQPIADRDRDCICLVATDAPLRYHGWVPRLFQHLFQL